MTLVRGGWLTAGAAIACLTAAPAFASAVSPHVERAALPSAARLHADRVVPAVRPAIVGGTTASAGSWGFMAFVLYVGDSGPSFACSGTVIAPKLVLTAGHCAVDEDTGAALAPAGYRVFTGSLDWSNAAGRQLSAVSRVVVFPDYDPSTGAGDAAVLVLSTPTSAASVPLATAADQYLYDGNAPAQIAGWGTTAAGGQVASTLQWADTTVQSPDYCEQLYPLFSPRTERVRLTRSNSPQAHATVTAAARCSRQTPPIAPWRSGSRAWARSTATPTAATCSREPTNSHRGLCQSHRPRLRPQLRRRARRRSRCARRRC